VSEPSKRKKARHVLTRAGYKVGGHLDAKQDKREIDSEIRKAFTEHDNQLHGGKKTRLRLKDGGCAEGGAPKSRADRKGRGKAHTTVNVVVAGSHPRPQPVPVPVPAGGSAPQGAMPPGAGPGGPIPPGAGGPPPGGFKKGGRTRSPKIDSQRLSLKAQVPPGHFKRGGKSKGYPIKDGAGGGEGRLQKAKSYGA